MLAVLSEVGAACCTLSGWYNVSTESIQWMTMRYRVESARRASAFDTERGDFYTFLGIAAAATDYRLLRASDIERRKIFVKDLASRINGHSNHKRCAFRAYPAIIRKYLLERLDYAFMVASSPRRRVSWGFALIFTRPFRGIKIKVKGQSAPGMNLRSHVERANLTVRHFNKRFTRLGLGWSRKLENHKAAISLFVAAYNFCKVHSTLGCTCYGRRSHRPCMIG